ncbi:MAG: hypothetical protein GWP59_04690 [Chlamydiales bacterium]|nr:hypothetical protein [Chlamydiales bacterium]NCF70982.1 hypothetical protein [Chlamydiales bacterium]
MPHSKIGYYLTTFTIIFTWWFCAFVVFHEPSIEIAVSSNQLIPAKQSSPFASSLPVDQLSSALTGNLDDIESICQLYEETAYHYLESSPEFSQNMLSRLQKIRYYIFRERSLSLKISTKKYFPQSYHSALALLSLLPEANITAIPEGVRKYNKLYKDKQFHKIALNCESCNSEQIFLTKTDLAFVAPYSLPKMFDTLNRLQIPVYVAPACYKLNDISALTHELSQKVDKENKGLLLSCFFEASLHYMQHLFEVLDKSFPRLKFKNSCVLNYYHKLSIAGKLSFNYQLLDYIGASQLMQTHTEKLSDNWNHPLAYEELQKLNPSFIFINSPQAEKVIHFLKSSPESAHLSALKKSQCFALDERFSDNPSLLVILSLAEMLRAFEQTVQKGKHASV